MKMDNTDRRILKALLTAAALVLAIIYFDSIMSGAAKLRAIISPILMGLVYAYVLNILIVKIDKIYFPHSTNKYIVRTRRTMCIVLAIIAVLAALALIVYIVLPQLVNAISSLASAVPAALEMAGGWLEDNQQYVPEIATRLNLDLEEIGAQLNEWLLAAGKGLGTLLLDVLGGLPSRIINLVMGMVIAIYLLSGKEKLLVQADRLQRAFLKPVLVKRINNVLAVANQTFGSFIAGQFTEAIILGSLCTLGMLILGFPYATTIGVFIGATALIPIFGAYIGAAVGVLLIVVESPIQALLFVIYVVILQQLEGNLIYPRVVGTSIGLPGMYVMIAVIIGGGLGGITGMLIGVPLMATAYKLLRTETRRRLEVQDGEASTRTR